MASQAPERDAALVAAERAYEVGDYRRVRELAGPIASGQDESAKKRARALLARVQIDRVQVAVLLACVVGFMAVVVTYCL